jgi:RimJ/RimL family protein N-acetyltransferase
MNSILNEATNLRKLGKITEAYQYVESNLSHSQNTPLWVHHPIFWKEMRAGSCVLQKRSQKDIQFLYALWKEPQFIERFNCLAPPLPKDPEDLKKILEKEHYSTIDESKEFHWIVRCKNNHRYGLLSLMDISLTHKKAEVLFGLLPQTPLGIAPTAMYILFKFFFEILNFNKLYTYVAVNNQHSLKGTLHLGFKNEGLLKSEIFDPISKSYVDLIRTGINKQEALLSLQSPLAKRLLSRSI